MQRPPPTTRSDSRGERRRRTWLLEIAALALFVGLAVFHTWPLATAPGTFCRNDTGDAVLNEWILSWVAHQAVTDPLHLFDANIFYPERRTLAYSEHMLPQALLVAPLLWAGGSPVLAFNLSLLAGFALTGWAVAHVVGRWTGSWAAGIVAGSLAAFNAHSLTRLPHLQALHMEFLPLALLAFDSLLRGPALRPAIAMAGWFVLQSLTSGYFLLFSAVAMLSAALARVTEWLGPARRRVVPLLLLSAAIAGLALLPFLVPYYRVREEQGLVRTIGELELYSARFTDYLATGALVHFKAWSQPFFRGDALFPGVLHLLLAGTALAAGLAFKDARARMCLVVAAVCFCLSFGIRFPPYPWLFSHVPLFQGLRAAVRFGHVALLALGMLAGFGAAWWLARTRHRGVRIGLAALLIVLVNAEAWRGPLFYSRFAGIPRIYKTLAGQPEAVVAYVPLHGKGDIARNTRYMLGSTLNWRPMLNGYSGFIPRSYLRHVDGLDGFPEPQTLDYLRHTGVTHVVVDGGNMHPTRLARVKQAPGLRQWATDGTITIYRLQ